MSNLGSGYSCSGGSSGNEADSENEEQFDKEIRDITEMMNEFRPYIFEPEKEVSSTSQTSSSNEDESENDGNDEDCGEINDENVRVGKLNWCKCELCSYENREIDCLCCQEVDALNSKFDDENIHCVTESTGFATLCTNKLVLANVLTGLHETKGDYLEKSWSNRSLRYAAYKQFIWWVFEYLGKGNRRVIPSCALWKIRGLYPEPNNDYVLYSEGKQD